MRFAPIILSIVAICIASFSVFQPSSNPLGNGLSAYNLTTPEAACKSILSMTANNDIRALIELERLSKSQAYDEQLDTLSIHKEVNSRGRKLLFVSFKNNGVPKYEVRGFEKDAETGFWTPAYVSSYSIKEYDKRLSEQIKSWEALGGSASKSFSEIADELGK